MTSTRTIQPGDVVELTYHDHGRPRVEQFTVAAVHVMTDGPRPGVWVSPWTAAGAEAAGWHHIDGVPCVHGDLEHHGMIVGWIDGMPHGGTWVNSEDLTLVAAGHVQGDLLELLEVDA